MSLSPMPPDVLADLLPDGLDADVVTPDPRTAAAAAANLPGADVVVGDFSATLPVTADLVAAMDAAQLFHQFQTGYDAVDVDALTVRGIPLTNAGRAASVALGEHVVMATLALLRSLAWCDRQVRAGAWPMHEVVGRSLVELHGRTVGLLGFGHAAEEAAARFGAFGCRVLYTARRRRPAAVEDRHGVTWRDLDDLLAEADVVVVLAALNPSTHGLLDAARVARMKAGAFLVNAARAPIVDEAALADALGSGRLAGAAIDVAATEPPGPEWPLRALDNVLLTPHTGGATVETRQRMLRRCVEVITAVAEGRLPDGVLNGVTRLRRVRPPRAPG